MLYIITLVSADLKILLFSQVKASSDACCNVTQHFFKRFDYYVLHIKIFPHCSRVHYDQLLLFHFGLILQSINNILNLHFHFQVPTQSSPPLN
jgi:hypothetical protein